MHKTNIITASVEISSEMIDLSYREGLAEQALIYVTILLWLMHKSSVMYIVTTNNLT